MPKVSYLLPATKLERMKLQGDALREIFFDIRRQIGKLAKLGVLLDAEEDFLDALEDLGHCVMLTKAVGDEIPGNGDGSLEAEQHLMASHEALGRWCSQGSKLVALAATRVEHCVEDVREARELMVFHIDDNFLSHVFSSVFISQFDAICAKLSKLPGPDLQGHLGKRATRAKMEKHLRNELKELLLNAMCVSLEEVTAEISKCEQPALKKIKSVTRHSADLPSHDDAEALELSMQHHGVHDVAIHALLHWTMHCALELALEFFVDTALGPIGFVIGVAAFAVSEVKPANWQSEQEEFVRQLKKRHVELVSKARDPFDFAELGELRRRKIVEQMDALARRFRVELSQLEDVTAQFAKCSRTQSSLLRSHDW